MGQTALLSFRRKACWGFFFCPENSDCFGRVWTRELGYQHATARPPRPLIRRVSLLYVWCTSFSPYEWQKWVPLFKYCRIYAGLEYVPFHYMFLFHFRKLYRIILHFVQETLQITRWIQRSKLWEVIYVKFRCLEGNWKGLYNEALYQLRRDNYPKRFTGLSP